MGSYATAREVEGGEGGREGGRSWAQIRDCSIDKVFLEFGKTAHS